MLFGQKQIEDNANNDTNEEPDRVNVVDLSIIITEGELISGLRSTVTFIR